MAAAAKCCSYCGSIMSCVAPRPCANTTAGCGPAVGGSVSQAAQRVPADGKSTRWVEIVMCSRMVTSLIGTVYVFATLQHVRRTCQGVAMKARFTIDEIA